MIIDHLENFQRYVRIKKDFKKAFAYLTQTNFDKLKEGVYDIDGDNMFAIIGNYETKDRLENKAESHRKYIDLQFMASGTELMGYAPLIDQKPIEEYKEDNDIMFYDSEVSFTRLEENMFAILFPEDLHMPGIMDKKSEKVKKIVIKIAV